MKAVAPLALLALVPAAIGGPAAAAGATVLIPLCTGDGQIHMVPVPRGGGPAPGGDPAGCCAKGCHTGSCRKRAPGEIEPSQ